MEYNIETILSVVTKTKSSTLAPKTSTMTAWSTITTTATVPPSYVNSTTVVTQTTPTTTTTTTTSTTSTIVTPTITYSSTTTSYAACATNNILGPDITLDGNPEYLIGGYAEDSTWAFSWTETDNHYDCCVLCQQNDQCGAAVFSYYSDINHCYLAVSNSTSARTSQEDGAIYYTSTNDSSYEGANVAVSNGPVGYAFLQQSD